jgi:hypothetical protein
MSAQYEYLEGGNPQIAAGMFRKKAGGRWARRVRIAWWPAGYPVTPVNMGLIIQEHERTGDVVTRARCIELLTED